MLKHNTPDPEQDTFTTLTQAQDSDAILYWCVLMLQCFAYLIVLLCIQHKLCWLADLYQSLVLRVR